MEFLASIHPKVVHFPIAFLMLYPVMETFYFFTSKDFYLKTALLFLIIGVIGSVLAVFTGNQAYQSIVDWSKEGKEIFSAHQTYANLTVWYFAFILVARYFMIIKKKFSKKFAIIFIVLSLIGGYFVYQTGLYGAELADNLFRTKLFNTEFEK